jgi:EAL domain-containing protein (putative c-di-GMP-specific phosphodiesterase class I)/GGDEF domain-containing protein
MTDDAHPRASVISIAGRIDNDRPGEPSKATVGLEHVRRTYRDVVTDPGRLGALQQLAILDTEPEEAFGCIVDIVRRTFNVAIARIHLVDETRQWIHTDTGHSGGSSISVDESACQYVIRQYSTFVIPDFAAEPSFQDRLPVIDGETMRFYAGAPLTTTDGHNIGVLCLLDTEPRAGLDDSARALLERIAELVVQAMEMRIAHEGAKEDLTRAIDEDPITGLVSRRGLLLRLQRFIESGHADNEPVGVIELRPGRADRVEQAYGPPVINQLLRDMGERLKAAARADEIVGRPDELGFTVVAPLQAPDAASVDAHIDERARELMDAFAAPFDVAGNAFQPETSVGLARAPADSRYAHELLGFAHEAAVRAGKRRANRIGWPDRQAVAAERQKLSLEGRLRRAVAEGELVPYYQAIVDVTGVPTVVGAEALLRWSQIANEQAIGPDVFIPLAEELGLIERIGRQVFEASCQQLRTWQAQSWGQDFWIAVNLAPSQLQNPDLASEFVDIARSAGVSPARIRLEITESAFQEGFDIAGPVIDELAEAGFALALDDFGTGHSSLSRLINMPFRVLKVDRSFVAQSPDGAGAAVVSSMSQLARSLKMAALGEGVETEVHEQFLRDCGYAYAQGYRYNRPVSAADFEAWCNSHQGGRHGSCCLVTTG